MNNTEKLMTEYRRQFYLTYHKQVLPLLLRFENKRKNYLNIVWVLESAIIFLLLFVAGVWNNVFLELWPMFLIFAVILMIFIPYYINSKFVKELKSYCLKPILDIFGAITWKKNAIDSVELEQSELFGYFNRRSTDDGFEGEYKGVNFEMAETHLAHESGSGKNRHYHVVFNGVVIKYESNKPIRAKTMIATKGDMNTKARNWGLFITPLLVLPQAILTGKMPIIIFGAVLSLLIIILMLRDLHKKNLKKQLLHPIHLEDPAFEKKFNAYSTDEIEGRYLITTAFMERFMNLQTAFGSKRAKCAFYNNSIMFAISTNKNLFEIGNLFTKLENPKQMNEFFDEFASILLLVEHFKLDEKTGL